MISKDFLIEIGTEELPPCALPKLIEAFANNLQTEFGQNDIAFGEIIKFSTPRRLAIKVTNLATKQPNREVERKGPALAAAYDANGNPTKALLGFAKSCSAEINQLSKIDTPKGLWLMYKSMLEGRDTIDLLPNVVINALKKLPIPKMMRWGEGKVEFIRPVHWVVMLYGNDIVSATILGKQTDRITFGHRFHCVEPIEIATIGEYESKLFENGHVIVDFSKRQQVILAQVNEIAEKIGAKAVCNESLLTEITNLVEWPHALKCSFDKSFLQVPKEALIASMQDHQKCLPLENSSGQLLPYFITVSNIESVNESAVIEGNETVMRARLADAKFFYQNDLKIKLEDHLSNLSKTTFQAKLGSIADKTKRISELAGFIAQIIDIDVISAKRAGFLSKMDLDSAMVYEFTELQGIMGQYYATNQNEGDEVSIAIREQYMPRFAQDDLPKTLIGCAVSLADKIDTLVGIFGIGKTPTGDKDPFALRRAAIGVLRILIEKNLNIGLVELIDFANDLYKSCHDKKWDELLSEHVFDFFMDRLKVLLKTDGIDYCVFESVLAVNVENPFDFVNRAQAVTKFIRLAESASLVAANKRVYNILAKNAKHIKNNEINEELFKEEAEKNLYSKLKAKSKELLSIKNQYDEILLSLIDLKKPIDEFFDKVMVMDEDLVIRNNRLALLSELRQLFLQVADISKLN